MTISQDLPPDLQRALTALQQATKPKDVPVAMRNIGRFAKTDAHAETAARLVEEVLSSHASIAIRNAVQSYLADPNNPLGKVRASLQDSPDCQPTGSTGSSSHSSSTQTRESLRDDPGSVRVDLSVAEERQLVGEQDSEGDKTGDIEPRGLPRPPQTIFASLRKQLAREELAFRDQQAASFQAALREFLNAADGLPASDASDLLSQLAEVAWRCFLAFGLHDRPCELMVDQDGPRTEFLVVSLEDRAVLARADRPSDLPPLCVRPAAPGASRQTRDQTNEFEHSSQIDGSRLPQTTPDTVPDLSGFVFAWASQLTGTSSQKAHAVYDFGLALRREWKQAVQTVINGMLSEIPEDFGGKQAWANSVNRLLEAYHLAVKHPTSGAACGIRLVRKSGGEEDGGYLYLQPRKSSARTPRSLVSLTELAHLELIEEEPAKVVAANRSS